MKEKPNWEILSASEEKEQLGVARSQHYSLTTDLYSEDISIPL